MDEQNQSYDPQLQLAIKFSGLKKEKDNLKDSLTKVQEELDATEAKLMEMLEAQNLEQVRYDNIGLITIKKPKVTASIIEGQEEILFENLEKMGRGDLVKRTVNRLSLASFFRELLEQGQEIPEGGSYYLLKQLSYTAAK